MVAVKHTPAPSTTDTDHPVGTVLVHVADSRRDPAARRLVKVTVPGGDWPWRRLTGQAVATTATGLGSWRVQDLAEVAAVLGHPEASSR